MNQWLKSKGKTNSMTGTLAEALISIVFIIPNSSLYHYTSHLSQLQKSYESILAQRDPIDHAQTEKDNIFIFIFYSGYVYKIKAKFGLQFRNDEKNIVFNEVTCSVSIHHGHSINYGVNKGTMSQSYAAADACQFNKNFGF